MASRALTPLLCLLAGCTVRTGLCEVNDDCGAGQTCNTATHRCEAAGAADLSATEPADLAAEEDLSPLPPPDLAGVDLLDTGVLEVERTGNGAGVIRSAPEGIDCGVRCTALFPRNTRVTLTVTPGDDAFLYAWSGECRDAGACEVLIAGTKKVGAELRRRSFKTETSGTAATLRAIFGVAGVSPPAGALFAAGDGGKVVRWDGTRWRELTNPHGYPLHGLWGSAANNVWFVGKGPPIRWNGSAFVQASGAFINDFWAAWGSAVNNVWAVGEQGGAGQYDGTSWSDQNTETLKALRGLWGSSASDIWAVGLSGSMQRWDGTTWKTVASGAAQNLYAVWGAGPDDIWTVGQAGTVLRRKGGVWTRQTPPRMDVSLRAVFGFGGGGTAQEVWMVGEQGVVLRWKAGAWSTALTDLPVVGAPTLYGIWGDRPGERLWAVGDSGLLMRYDAHR